MSVIGYGVQISRDLIRVKLANSGTDCSGGKVFCTTAVRSHPGQQIRRDRNEARGRELICHVFNPIGHTEDLVDHDNHRSFVAAFGISHKGLD